MTLIRKTAGPNPLKGWQVDPSTIRTAGHDLSRPECILAERDGSLWTADARGGVVHIRPDGSQKLVVPAANGGPGSGAAPNLFEGTLPNGLAFARNGDLLIANFGTDTLDTMTRDGRSRVLCDSIDGKPLGKVNFVLRDRCDRLWITISTKISPWNEAISSSHADGYIVLIDGKGPRIVAEGFFFTNEIRLDAQEEWLYVAETCARRVTRLRVAADGSLRGREVYGPSSLGSGLIDGIAFDAYGNLWATMIFADRLVAITPEGELLILFDDGDRAAAARFDAEFDSGKVISVETMSATGGKIAPWAHQHHLRRQRSHHRLSRHAQGHRPSLFHQPRRRPAHGALVTHISRRGLIAGAALGLAPRRSRPAQRTSAARCRRSFSGGTAISAYQSEGKQYQRRRLGTGEREADAVQGALGRRLRLLSSLCRGHRDRGKARLQLLPLRNRVGAHRAERRLLLQRRARPLRPSARDLPRARPQARRHLQPLHHADLVRGARRFRGGGFARSLRAVLRQGGGESWRADASGDHFQRGEHRVSGAAVVAIRSPVHRRESGDGRGGEGRGIVQFLQRCLCRSGGLDASAARGASQGLWTRSRPRGPRFPSVSR